ncbi:MAG: hypothetical protein KF836_08190 [Fimbriimonadaceae bacterium]|nr:hypothetical protein [Fimbriimonadaceae bacterium]
METKPDSFNQRFEIHTPLTGRRPGWNLAAGCKDNLIFRVHLGNRAHTIQVGGETWRLAGKVGQHDKVVFHVEGPSPTPAIFQESIRKFEFRVEYADHTFFMRVLNNIRVLCDAVGIPIASLSNSWNDDDSIKNIRYWLHYSQNVSPHLLAIFFCMSKGFDLESEEGL